MNVHYQPGLFDGIEETAGPAPVTQNIPVQDRPAGDAPDNEIKLAAMRRELYQKGRRVGKDLGVESVERFGMPIYRLPWEIVTRWSRVLDEQIEGGSVTARGRHG